MDILLDVNICLGDLGNEVCDYSCLTELVAEHWDEHPWPWGRMQFFCHTKQVSIWDTPHSSLGRGACFPFWCYGKWCFKRPLGMSFYHMYTKFRWSSYDLIKISHNQLARLYNQCLSKEIYVSVGHEAKVRDNIVHEILQPRWYIILYNSINITPEQHLRMPMVKPLIWEAQNFPHATQNTRPLTEYQLGQKAWGMSFNCMATYWSGILRGKATPYAMPTCPLGNNDSFPEYVWKFRVKVIIQKLNPRNPQY